MAKIVSSFNTTLTPTNRYGFCRIPDGNGPLGSIAVMEHPFLFTKLFHLRHKNELHHYKNMYQMEW